jgi:hypothetical protein
MRYKLSRILLILVVAAVSFGFVAKYHNNVSIWHGDAMGYYMYLPATFIYHNHKSMDTLPKNFGIPPGPLHYAATMRQNHVITPTGHVLNQYTYGVALMEAPFFFVAHIYAKIAGYWANGFSEPYMNAIKISSFVYALLGLMVVYRLLRRYFPSGQSLLTVAILYVGTNMLWFALYQGGMAHLPLFFLYSLLLWFTVRVHEKKGVLSFIGLGLVGGIITVIRPTDIVCMLVPLCYGVYNKETLHQKMIFLKQHFSRVIVLIFVFALPVLPQLFYWKMLSGSYLFYSYGAQTFNWKDPKIIEGLFYFKNGWLAYSPVMVFSLLGLLIAEKFKSFALGIWLLLPLYIYIIYSWYCYNYINGFGSRPMIHMYPLLAFPLCAFLWFISRRGIVLRSVFAVVCIFFVALSISFSIQQATAILISEDANWGFISQTLFRTRLRYSDLITYDTQQVQPDTGKITKMGVIAYNDYEDSTSPGFYPDPTGKSKYVYLMMGTDEHHPHTIHVPYNEKTHGGAKWFKCTGRFMVPEPPGYYKHLFIMSVDRGGNFSLWDGVKVQTKIANGEEDGKPYLYHHKVNTWREVSFFSKVPKEIQNGDNMSLDIWNLTKQPIYFDDLKLELYK